MGLTILTGIISAITFILYVMARMKEQDQKEKSYRLIHFLSLFLFVILGVILLIMVSDMNL
jgi:formate hydrogenlyase subunit 3/multisubunit Na+/H+ antiporter MnhD subunit